MYPRLIFFRNKRTKQITVPAAVSWGYMCLDLIRFKLLTLSRLQVLSTGALASSWQVKSKYALGWTADKETEFVNGRRMFWLEIHVCNSSTLRRSSSSKWTVRLDVRGSTLPLGFPSNVTTEKPNVLTSVMVLLKSWTWIDHSTYYHYCMPCKILKTYKVQLQSVFFIITF